MSGDASNGLIDGRYRVIASGEIEEQGVDAKDGTPVLVRPPLAPGWTQGRFLNQEELETTARIAASLDTPWLLPVLCASSRVVYAVPPPPTRPDSPLATSDAALCLLQLCDVLARAHAAGFAGIGADIHDVRVHREGGAWRITVVLPHLPPRGRWPHSDLPPWQLSPIRRDLWTAVSFFRDLLLAREPPPYDKFRDSDPPLPPFGNDAAHALLSELLSARETNDGVKDVKDVASLAERILPLSRSPEDWQSRVATMPRVSTVTVRHDFDRLIVLGEEERAASQFPQDPYLLYPLAAAYHQRACAAHARGDFEAALRDVEKAISLDNWPRYFVTRGVVHAALGDHEGAYVDYEVAVSLSKAPHPPEHESVRDPELMIPWEWPGAKPAEGAHAHYARGIARYRRGDLPGAREDLLEALSALSIASEPFWRGSPQEGSLADLEIRIRRSLLPVLRATLRADPGELRWRWALARNLLELGRKQEARAVADEILSLYPGDDAMQKRYARMFAKDASR